MSKENETNFMLNETTKYGKARTMLEAYDLFTKQTNNACMARIPVNDRCKGIYCNKEECRNACGALRKIRTKQ